jgi:hypothetical protein
VDLGPQQPEVNANLDSPFVDVVARSPTPQLATEDSVMTDASGNVIAFDSTAVFKGMYSYNYG